MNPSKNRERHEAKRPEDADATTAQDRVSVWAETKEKRTNSEPGNKGSCELPLIFRLL